MSCFRPILAAHGLTEQQWRVMRVLAETSGLRSKDLARRTLISSPSLSGVIDRLERARLVDRRRDARDARTVWVRLTPKGKRLFRTVGPEIEARYEEIRSRMAADELDTLYRALRRVIALDGSATP